jgi:hypothetical protein
VNPGQDSDVLKQFSPIEKQHINFSMVTPEKE